MRKTIERDATGRPVVTPTTGRTRPRATFDESDRMAEGREIVVYLTGPIDGVVQLPTGTEYDVTEPVIAVHPDHRAALHQAIHAEHHRRGRCPAGPRCMATPLEGE